MVGVGDPCGTDAAFDITWSEVCRDDGFECVNVALEGRVGDCCGLCLTQFETDVAGKVFLAGDVSDLRVLTGDGINRVPKFMAGRVGICIQKAGDVVEVHLTGLIQAQREGIRGIVDAGNRPTRLQHALLEQSGRHRGLGGVIEIFQGGNEGAIRVLPELGKHRRASSGDGAVLGDALGVSVDGPVGVAVALVTGA